MNKEIRKLEGCLEEIKKCLKIPKVESCVCFSDAFKVLNAEIKGLFDKIDQLPDIESKEKLKLLNREISEIKNIIAEGTKECLGCTPCKASVIFKSYPDRLNNLYLENEL